MVDDPYHDNLLKRYQKILERENIMANTKNANVAKTPNYTADQTAKAIADYKAGVTVETIAASLGKSARSVTAKLVREGVYVKKAATAKDGSAIVSKDDLADKIGVIVGTMTEADVSSLTKANKTALNAVLSALNAGADALVDVMELDDDDEQF